MSKLYLNRISVRTGPDGLPVSFSWRGRLYQVAACAVIRWEPSRFEYWREPEPDRYRCETAQGMVCDLVEDGRGWVLERVWD